jgi:phage shock protein C
MTQPQPPSADRRLRRSSADKLLFGVCGGLARHLEVDPVLVRLAFVVLGALVWGVIAYLALAVLMPQDNAPAATPAQTAKQNVEEIGRQAAEAARSAGDAIRERPVDRDRAMWVGGLLVIAGVLILAANLGWLSSWFWFRWWPLAVIGVGLALVYMAQDRTKR